MLRRTEISQADFEQLLNWFGTDRDPSAAQYLAAHRTLTAFFRYNYCNRPEDLADEVLNRVAKKLPPLLHGSDQTDVLIGFARYLLKEYWDDDELFCAKEISNEEHTETKKSAGMDVAELRLACLDKCLSRLPEQALLLEYHRYEPGGKIAHRRAMAETRHCTLNALRLKTSGLKSTLEECVRRCCQSGELTQVQ